MQQSSRHIIFFCLLLLPFASLYSKSEQVQFAADSIAILEMDTATIEVQSAWTPDPLRAVWMGAIIPGYGQIYNRKYWKLPIVYGGFMGCAYAISWNSVMYSDYNRAYYDMIDTDPLTDSYLDILPEGYTVENLGGMQAYEQILKTKRNSFRRYRDMSVLITIAFYALTLVDAYVDAQLYDFDITPDLSLQIQPAIHHDEFKNNERSTELQLSLTF